MKLRPPATPLITVDPYFSIWCMGDKLNADVPRHWTGSPNTITGKVKVGEQIYCFMGNVKDAVCLPQISRSVDALTTTYVFENSEVTVEAKFTATFIPGDLYLFTRPVGYLEVKVTTASGDDAEVTISASDELCLNLKGEGEAVGEVVPLGAGSALRLGNKEQKPLWRSGDGIRIDWGYFYLASAGDAEASIFEEDGMKLVSLTKGAVSGEALLFLFAYDDIESIDYFGDHLKSYWNRCGESITEAIERAISDYDETSEKAKAFSDRLICDATMAGGAKYAELLSLAWRQVCAAHKLVLDTNGDILYISKECYSNGCAATVDVSYPSIPMYLLYDPELVLGMMRPIFKFAASESWPFDFAPHDAGQYPLVCGQVYNGTSISGQMPVEECGNMLVMTAAAAIAMGNADFAASHLDTLIEWAEYLIKYGEDPENQLCTDDFAGHMAHNCNLSLKAVSGLAGLSIILGMTGDAAGEEKYMEAARAIASSWAARASNGDGSYRLAFDREGSYSMKYNMVWDKLFGTRIFPDALIAGEIRSNFDHFNPYGMPLDNRATYTKSDWLVWTATLADDRDTFERYIEPLWLAYHLTPSRVPMTDWYDTVTSKMVGFQHRTVQGGLFIKLLEATGKMKVK